ncbi:hypothetical protein V8E53_003990 [Lactarius tabidus]
MCSGCWNIGDSDTSNAKQNEYPSLSDSSSSSSDDPPISDPKDDEEEEDFAADLAKISDGESDSDRSDPPSPSPHPQHSGHSVLNPQAIRGALGDTPPSLPERSSNSLCAAQLSREQTTPDSPHRRLSQLGEHSDMHIRAESMYLFILALSHQGHLIPLSRILQTGYFRVVEVLWFHDCTINLHHRLGGAPNLSH